MKRLTYAEDGSSIWKVITSFAPANQTALTAQEKTDINGDQTQTGNFIPLITVANTFSGIILKFAKACNIDKLFLSFRYVNVTGTPATTLLVEASGDSTDGNNGTWTTLFTESHTIRAANSDSRLFLKAQTDEESSTTYTYLRVSWSGNVNLNNLRLLSFWVYAEYTSPPYDFYDAQGVTKLQLGESVLGLFAGNAAVQKNFRFKIKNNDSVNRTYALTFAKVKAVADAVFVANVGLNTDGGTGLNASVNVGPVAPGEMGDFYLRIDIPANGQTNGNPQDAQVHYGKITITATGVTVTPGFFFAVYYDTLANIELIRGTGLINICLIYQRDATDEGKEIAAWSWWDLYGLASCVQQEDVGNDIGLLLTSNGYLWEMDRNEFDNEEFSPEPILMVFRTVETPSQEDPHIWRRNLYFDFDVDGADAGVIAEYLLTAHKTTGKVTTSKDIQIANAAMRVDTLDVGHQFNHELRITTGGRLAIKNWGAYYQDLALRGRQPYIA